MKALEQLDMFDPLAARTLRNEGMESAESNSDEWRGAAIMAFVSFTNTGVRTFITEDFRRWWRARGDYHEPRHHNAWGAFTATLLRNGLIRPTGRVRAVSAIKSHARKMLEWEVSSKSLS